MDGAEAAPSTLIGRFRHRFLTSAALLRLIPISLVLVTGIVLNIWTHTLLNDRSDMVVHTHTVIAMSKDVLIGLDDAETGQRGYLLSGDNAYLEPYTRARERLSGMSAELQAMVSDNPEQTARVQTLLTLMAKKLDELAAAITIHDTQGFAAGKNAELYHMRIATMDDIRKVIGQITEGEKSLLEIREAEVQAVERQIVWVAILVALASFVTRWAVELWLNRRRD